MKFEDASVAFKRSIHALSYALSLSEDIQDDNERELFNDLLNEFFFCDTSQLFDFLESNFTDYADYSQLEKGHFSGIWFQKMQKENEGTTFLRKIIGNEFTAPRPASTFADFSDKKVDSEYVAEQLFCFFVPFNSPIDGLDFSIDEANHIALSLEQLKYGGTHNAYSLKAEEFGSKICSALDESTKKNNIGV